MCVCSFIHQSNSIFFFCLLQTEIAKRLNVICAQLIPFLSQEVTQTDTHTHTHTHILYCIQLSLSPPPDSSPHTGCVHAHTQWALTLTHIHMQSCIWTELQSTFLDRQVFACAHMTPRGKRICISNVLFARVWKLFHASKEMLHISNINSVNRGQKEHLNVKFSFLNPPALTDLLVCSTASTTGGPGHGARQTGDHGGAKCFNRGTWAPPSAS